MIVSILNKSGSTLSTPLGSVTNGAVVSMEMSDSKYIAIQPELLALEAKGYVTVSLVSKSTAETEQVTRAPITLYVDSNLGNDTNAGTSVAPFRTLQAAVNAVPKIIMHKVLISVASGTYDGVFIDGFECRIPSVPATDYSGLELRGTLIPATLAQGNVSGTITGYVAASAGVPAVVTDASQNWAVNALVGKMLQLKSGTGFPGTESTPPLLVIIANTATTATVLGPTTATSATYDVVDFGTIINNAPTVAAVTGSIPLQAVSRAGIVIGSTNRGSAIGLSRLLISCGTNLPVGIRGVSTSGLRMVGCRITGANSQSVTSLLSTNSVTAGNADVGSLSLSQCSLLVPNNCAGITLGQSATTCSIATTYIEGGSATFATGITVQTASRSLVSNSYLRGLTPGIQSNSPFSSGVFVSGTTIDGNNVVGSVGISAPNDITTLNLPGINLNFQNGVIANCATAAIQLNNPTAVAWFVSGSGTGNAIGFSLAQGAKVKVAPGVTLTGTTEVQLDGAAGTTLAAMRAASPKLLTNTYGTLIYE